MEFNARQSSIRKHVQLRSPFIYQNHLDRLKKYYAERSIEIPTSIDLQKLRMNCPSSGDIFLNSHLGEYFSKPWTAPGIKPDFEFINEAVSSEKIEKDLKVIADTLKMERNVMNEESSEIQKQVRRTELNKEREGLFAETRLNDMPKFLYEDVTLETLDRDQEKFIEIPNHLKNMKIEKIYHPDVLDIMADVNDIERLISKIDVVPMECFLEDNTKGANTPSADVIKQSLHLPKFPVDYDIPPLIERSSFERLNDKFWEDIYQTRYDIPTFIRKLLEDICEMAVNIGQFNIYKASADVVIDNEIKNTSQSIISKSPNTADVDETQSSLNDMIDEMIDEMIIEDYDSNVQENDCICYHASREKSIEKEMVHVSGKIDICEASMDPGHTNVTTQKN